MFLDIGGRGGLSRPWSLLSKAGLLKPIYVEPDGVEAERLRLKHGAQSVLETALWSSSGRRDLYLTEEPGCSSMLIPEPDRNVPDAVKKMLPVREQLSVACARADDELGARKISPDILKIDVQGGELEVLKGFGNALNSVQCIEMEVYFMRCYRDQPLFDDIFQYMTEMGFGLFDLQVFGVKHTRNGIQANAFFCRRANPSVRAAAIESVFRRVAGYSNWP